MPPKEEDECLSVASTHRIDQRTPPQMRGVARFLFRVLALAVALSCCKLFELKAQTVTATLPVGTAPRAIAVNLVTDTIYVANYGSAPGSADGSVSAINGATNAVTTLVSGSANPSAIAVNSATNKIYVANNGSSNITVIDGVTGNTNSVGVGSSPIALAVNPITNKIYVANTGSSNVSIIDGLTNTACTVATGASPISLAVNPLTNKIYIANGGDNTVTVLDGATSRTTSVNLGAVPSALAVNAVTNEIYVATLGAGTSSPGSLAVIDGATNTVATVSVGAEPENVVVNAETNIIYVSNSGSSSLTAVDGATLAVSTFATGAGPSSLAINPITNYIFVTNTTDGTVTAINGATGATVTLTTATGTDSIAVNPLTNRIYAGNGGNAANSINVIDGAANNFTSISVGNNPDGVTLDPVTNKLLFSNRSGLGILDTISLNETQLFQGIVSSVAVSPRTHNAYFSNDGIPSLLGVNLTNYEVVPTPVNIFLGLGYVNVNPIQGTLYWLQALGEPLEVIDPETYSVASVPDTYLNYSVAFNPVTNKLYFSGANNTVTEFDCFNKTVASIPVGTSPSGIDVNPVTNMIYVANQGLYEITAIDGATHKTQQIAVSGAFPSNLAVNPLTNKIYVSTQVGVAVVDGATNLMIASIPSPSIEAGYVPLLQPAIDLATNKIYVPYFGTLNEEEHDSTVLIIDGVTNMYQNLFTGFEPDSAAVHPVSNQILIANDADGTISVIDDRGTTAPHIVTQINPVENNTTSASAAQFSIATTDPIAGSSVGQVYYQIDTLQGPWSLASGQGANSFLARPMRIAPGFHTIYAFATDGQLISNTAGYYFFSFPTGIPQQTDFTGSFDTFNQRIAPGQEAVYNLTINPINGFIGDVFLSASNVPPGATVTFNPPQVRLGTGTMAITVSTTTATPVGSYDITITAYSGLLTHSTAITLNVGAIGDFIGSVAPNAANVALGGSTNYTLTLTPLEGFNAPVTFSVSGLPPGATGTFAPPSLANGSGSTVLTISTSTGTPTGVYSFTLTASTPGLSHSTSPTLLVGAVDFTGTIRPTSQTVYLGTTVATAQYTVQLSTVGTLPFGNTVTLSITGLPAGATASFSNMTINPDTHGTSILTITTSPTTPAGIYAPILTATGGGVSHSTSVGLVVF